MFKSLLKLALLLVVGILIYNYFLGTEKEQETSRRIFNEVKDLGLAVKDLLASEKEKFEAGKYDRALEKIGDLFEGLRGKAREIDEDYLQRLDQLEKKRKNLEKRLAELRKSQDIPESYDEFTPRGDDSLEVENIKRELRELMEETERLMDEMGQRES